MIFWNYLDFFWPRSYPCKSNENKTKTLEPNYCQIVILSNCFDGLFLFAIQHSLQEDEAVRAGIQWWQWKEERMDGREFGVGWMWCWEGGRRHRGLWGLRMGLPDSYRHWAGPRNVRVKLSGEERWWISLSYMLIMLQPHRPPLVCF